MIFPKTELGDDPLAIRDFALTAEELGYASGYQSAASWPNPDLDWAVSAGWPSNAGAAWETVLFSAAFHKGFLRRLAGLDVVPVDILVLPIAAPAGELRPVVADGRLAVARLWR